jgi:DNA gyrase subunit B
MTDADVDGSHIRTLLLTFFFRQMTDLIRRGHVYIAQPPLYRIQVGQKERYIQREKELTEFLMNRAIDNVEVVVAESGQVYAGTQLVKKVHDLMDYRKLYEKLSRKTGSNGLIDTLLEGMTQCLQNRVDYLEGDVFLADETNLRELSRFLESRDLKVQLLEDIEHSLFELKVFQAQNTPFLINHELLTSVEWTQLEQLYRRVSEFLGSQLMIRNQGRDPIQVDMEGMVQHIVSAGKKNLSLQRYKGLGEMNPEQLWETTMNPETRTLLKVNIEDAFETDEIFTILMGDQVEPRRQFIENNALNVKNLDV